LCANQPASPEIGPPEVGSRQQRRVELGPSQIGADERRVRQVGVPHRATPQVRAVETAGAHDAGTEVGAAEARLVKIHVMQVDVAELGSAQVGRDAMPNAPAVPGLPVMPMPGEESQKVPAMSAEPLVVEPTQQIDVDVAVTDDVEIAGQCAGRADANRAAAGSPSKLVHHALEMHQLHVADALDSEGFLEWRASSDDGVDEGDPGRSAPAPESSHGAGRRRS
jgi:hypothetical protein